MKNQDTHLLLGGVLDGVGELVKSISHLGGGNIGRSVLKSLEKRLSARSSESVRVSLIMHICATVEQNTTLGCRQSVDNGGVLCPKAYSPTKHAHSTNGLNEQTMVQLQQDSDERKSYRKEKR